MAAKFTPAQYAAAPAAWLPGGDTHKVRVMDRFQFGRSQYVECPVLWRHDRRVGVVMPDGTRLTVRV